MCREIIWIAPPARRPRWSPALGHSSSPQRCHVVYRVEPDARTDGVRDVGGRQKSRCAAPEYCGNGSMARQLRSHRAVARRGEELGQARARQAVTTRAIAQHRAFELDIPPCYGRIELSPVKRVYGIVVIEPIVWPQIRSGYGLRPNNISSFAFACQMVVPRERPVIRNRRSSGRRSMGFGSIGR